MGFGKDVWQKLFGEAATANNGDTVEAGTVAADGSIADTVISNTVSNFTDGQTDGNVIGAAVGGNPRDSFAGNVAGGQADGSMADGSADRQRNKKTVTETSENLYPKILYLLRCVLTGALAAIFGSAGGIFSCYPFGIAFLSAIEGMAIPAFIGVLVGAVISREYAVAASLVYLLTLFMRVLFRLMAERQAEQETAARTKHHGGKLHTDAAPMPLGEKILRIFRLELSDTQMTGGYFRESLSLRCLTAAFAAFVFGLYRLMSGGYLYYDYFGLLSGLFLTPVLTAMFGLAFFTSEEAAKYVRYTKFRIFGTATLFVCLIYALRGVTLFGFSPAFALTAAAAMTVSVEGVPNRRNPGHFGRGMLYGCVTGFIGGVAFCGTDSRTVILSAVGLAAGLLMPLSKLLAASGVVAVTTLFGLSAGGIEMVRSVLPDTLGALTVFLPLARYHLLPKLPFGTAELSSDVMTSLSVNEKKQQDTAMRIRLLSQSLEKLSDVIYTLSDRLRRPGIIDLKQVCDNSFEKYCSRCSLSSLCLEREYSSTLDAQSKMTTALYREGNVSVSDVPEYMQKRCYNIERIVTEMNAEAAALAAELVRCDRTSAFAIDYESLSKLLTETLAETEREYQIDSEATERLRRSLKYMDMPQARAICWGQRKKQVVIGGIELAGLRLGAGEIRRMTENLLRIPLTKPQFRVNGDEVEISMTARKRYRTESAFASGVKESESANGDTATVFDGRDDYTYALISDGMGSGKEAAVTSKLCAVFLEQLCGCTGSCHVGSCHVGNCHGNKTAVLELLNGFIRSRQNECSATIDLCEIDLFSGRANFIKSGAAPSFILRGGNLYKLQSKTVPIGIMPTIDAEQIGFDLEGGDIIVMLSDGVAQSLEDGVWLANLLTYEWEDSLTVMAEKIIDTATEKNDRKDDMTVILLRVSC